MNSLPWHIRIGNKTAGPVSASELEALCRRGGISPQALASTDGKHWIPAGDVPGLEFPAPVGCSISASARPNPRASRSASLVVLGGIGAAFLVLISLGGLLWIAITAVSRESDPASSPAGDRPISMSGEFSNPLPQGPPAARLSLRWREATPELLPLVERMTNEERAVLGLAVLTTGSDYYAGRVELRNLGDIPIRVFPQNLRVHLDGETAIVTTIDDPAFLRETILPPGQSASGLVLFSARLDVGSRFRSGEGAMSYVDPTITVTYP